MEDPDHGVDGELVPAKKGRPPPIPEPALSRICITLDALTVFLRALLEGASSAFIPQLIDCKFIFGNNGLQSSQGWNVSSSEPPDPKKPLNVLASLYRGLETRDRREQQRVYANAIMKAVERADEWRYSERNCSELKMMDGFRFKFVCRDSLQNRDRVSNGFLGRGKQKKRDADPDVKGSNRMPTYDCGGSVLITFSAKDETISVLYRHTPLHRNQLKGIVNAQSPATGQLEEKKKRKEKSVTFQKAASSDKAPAVLSSPNAKKTSTTNQSNGTAVATTADDKDQATNEKKRSGKVVNGISEAPTPKKRKSKAQSAAGNDVDLMPVPRSKGKAAEQPPVAKATMPTESAASVKATTPGKARGRAASRCLTCHSKHRKCDERRPVCKACARRGESCAYPDSFQRDDTTPDF